MANGHIIKASEFFDEDDPSFDYKLNEGVKVSRVDGWEYCQKTLTIQTRRRTKGVAMARNHLGSKSPFRTATLWLIWGWLLIFALLPNILVIAVSFLTRDSSAFISLPINIDSYVRMVDPLYFEVFVHSLWMAGITTVICLLLGYPFAWLVSKVKGWQPLLMLLLIPSFWTNSGTHLCVKAALRE